ncbi:MAG: CRISPR-associated endonuclease Cas1 [Salinisphaera sp.]|nr:CRISPR-associated endonuclease Cas1 [Salinisphaera sp.]
MTTAGKPLYVMGGEASLRLDGKSLRVLHADKSDGRIPLRRVSGAIVQPREQDQLQACLAIVQQGGTVHFLDGAGRICAMLHQPAADGSRWARELAQCIEAHASALPWRVWQSNQQRHAWSLVFRRGFRGDFAANRTRLLRYLAFYRPELETARELQWLEEQLLAWLHAQIAVEGLYPVVRAAHTQGKQLVEALLPCLLIPLLWAYVRWRRSEPRAMVAQRTDFFELQAAAPMHRQLQRHLHALAGEYQVACGARASTPDPATP